MGAEWKPSENLPSKSGEYKVKYRSSYTGSKSDTFKFDLHCSKCVMEWLRKIEEWHE